MFDEGNKKGRGRPKGSPNKANRLARELVEAALGGTLPEALAEIALTQGPKMKAQIYLGLMPYTYAKMQHIEHSGEIGSGDQEDVQEAIKALKEEIARNAAELSSGS